MLFTAFQACKEKETEEAASENSEAVVDVTPDVTPAAVVDTDTSRVPVPVTDPVKK